MMRIACLLLLGATMALTACGKKKTTNDMNGVSATDFYSQMIYTRSVGASPSHYLAPISGLEFVISELPGKKKVYADVSLFLLNKKDFVLVYDESLGCMTAQGQMKFLTVHQPIQGQWNINGDTMVLGGVGEGHGTVFNASASLNLTFKTIISDAGLSNKTVLLQYQPINSTMEDALNSKTLFDRTRAGQILDSSGCR